MFDNAITLSEIQQRDPSGHSYEHTRRKIKAGVYGHYENFGFVYVLDRAEVLKRIAAMTPSKGAQS